MSMLSQSPNQLVADMKKNGQHKAYLVYDGDRVKVSHPMFEELGQALYDDKRDYHQHEGYFLGVGPQTDHLLSAAVHCTTRGPGAGGVRYWAYDHVIDFVKDGLRLAEGMGRKNSLAGLWWGGGKGVIAREADERWQSREFRDVVFADYGAFMTSLRGCYITAEDLGANIDDMRAIGGHTRFTTCLPLDLGGSGNPSVVTGLGVACAIEGALDHKGMGEVRGKTFSIQGCGNVASPLMGRLIELGAGSIQATDVNPERVEAVNKRFGGKVQARLVPVGDLTSLFEDVDVVSPCAVGGVLSAVTIPQIRAKVVVGAANNQLLDDQKDDQLLHENGITYVPDFLANRMGIVQCSNEQYGTPLGPDPAVQRHFGRDFDNSIFLMTRRVLQLSEHQGITSAQAAMRLADELMLHPHPIWPNRSREIIRSLVDHDWHKQPWELPQPPGPL